MRNATIRNIDGETFSGTESEVFDALKAIGYKVGKTGIAALFEGKKDEYLGFSVIADADPETPAIASETTETPVAPESETEAPSAPVFDTTFLFPSAPPASAFAPKPEAPKAARAKKAIFDVAPKARIKPVRKNTKIANGLELLAAGADESALTAANLSADLVDFVMRRVTKRGYGVKVSDGIYSLVFPEGVSAIAYGNSAD